MNDQTKDQEQNINAYRKRATGYDQSGIGGLEAWRNEAIRALNLKRGDLVVDIGCGTGFNFRPLQEAVGPEGKIIGVDLTDAMLDQARQRVLEYGWKNVELAQRDASTYSFPRSVDGIVSTFALSLIPENAKVIQNGAIALSPGRMWVVLDMAWPDTWPLWMRHRLPFLRSWGITRNVIEGRPWKKVWEALERHLIEAERKLFWKGLISTASGKRPN